MIEFVCNPNDRMISTTSITITLPKETAYYLKKLAKLKKVSVSVQANTFIEEGLEDFEDEQWSKIADKIMKKDMKTISHEEFWGKVLKH